MCGVHECENSVRSVRSVRHRPTVSPVGYSGGPLRTLRTLRTLPYHLSISAGVEAERGPLPCALEVGGGECRYASSAPDSSASPSSIGSNDSGRTPMSLPHASADLPPQSSAAGRSSGGWCGGACWTGRPSRSIVRRLRGGRLPLFASYNGRL